jgi:hypothetical protein
MYSIKEGLNLLTLEGDGKMEFSSFQFSPLNYQIDEAPRERGINNIPVHTRHTVLETFL